MKHPNKLHLFLTVFLLILVGFLVSEKINLFTADLGRHIKNGEMILSGNFSSVLSTNFYSYTYPDFPFVNHHWGSGVVFCLVHRFLSFIGLSIFFVLVIVSTFWLFFDTAKKNSNFTVTFFSSILFLPLIVYRREIRPEIFSYFFCALFWWILSGVKNKRIAEKWLFILPAAQIIWINLHVYFFWGFILTGLFLMESYFENKVFFKKLLVIFGFLFLTSLVNPAGYKGLFYPLNIFKDYGYRVLENQTVLFIDRVFGKYPPNLYFKIAFTALLVSWVLALKKKNVSIINFCLFLLVSYLGWSAIRNFTVFAFFGLGIMAENINNIDFLKFRQKEKEIFVNISLGVFALFILFILDSHYWLARNLGWGVDKNTQTAINFFRQNNLEGPIFNNYDIGGYLIYYLFPNEKVFVDNRPEAYPTEFFTDTYVPMQENQTIWEEVDQKYGFNAVFFYRNDLTPWGHQFLVAMIQNSQWAPVFVDQNSIIFLKRNELNQPIIKKFELPKEMFQIKKAD